MNILKLIKRKSSLFDDDLKAHAQEIKDCVKNSRILVIGAAGTIGKATSIELFKRKPRALHLVDISENNTVELVRDIRSSLGYIDGDFRTFIADFGGDEFEALIKKEGPYDYIFNLSALKHVRSEKDQYSLMRMINVNILYPLKLLNFAEEMNCKKLFCVSTDKATNPVNMMGASKLIMEMFLINEDYSVDISMARFANVAFSDGSLLHGFNKRLLKKQPISAPKDVKRYFITPQESGELCLLSGILGKKGEIFFPKMTEDFHLLKFSDIASDYLKQMNYQPYECESESQARELSIKLIQKGKWPCYFFDSDTTGEKGYEEFFSEKENVDQNYFKSIGTIKKEACFNSNVISNFTDGIEKLKSDGNWNKDDILDLFYQVLPDFDHKRTGKNLDQKM